MQAVNVLASAARGDYPLSSMPAHAQPQRAAAETNNAFSEINNAAAKTNSAAAETNSATAKSSNTNPWMLEDVYHLL